MEYQNVRLVGNGYRPNDAQDAYYGLSIGDNLMYERDPNNEYDNNAIKVFTTEDVFIAFVDSNIAKHLAPHMDDKVIYSVKVDGLDNTGNVPYKTASFTLYEEE